MRSARSGYYAPMGGMPGLRQVPTRRATSGLGTEGAAGPSGLQVVYGVASTASVAGLAYHGYKRNRSIGWTVCWALVGGIFWPIAWGVALAQGYAKPRSGLKTNRRRRKRRTSRR